jgi:hypothetical protein
MTIRGGSKMRRLALIAALMLSSGAGAEPRAPFDESAIRSATGIMA